MRKTITVVASVLLVASTMAGCSGTEPVESESAQDEEMIYVDGPDFDSIGQLADASTIVVRGTFGSRDATASEGELNAATWDGLPMELWSFVIDDVLAGEGAAAGDSIQVSQLAVEADGATRPAATGRDAILFLKPYPVKATYAVVGLGTGAIAIDEAGELTAVSEDDHTAVADSLDGTSLQALQDEVTESFEAKED